MDGAWHMRLTYSSLGRVSNNPAHAENMEWILNGQWASFNLPKGFTPCDSWTVRYGCGLFGAGDRQGIQFHGAREVVFAFKAIVLRIIG
jgi:hypothetical protein